jgi:cytochrome P450
LPEHTPPDWDPLAPAVMRDQRAAYDAMRERCPVAHSDPHQWTVFGHADVARLLDDHVTFSSAVSHHVSVPNGLDPPEHTAWRQTLDPYFSPERVRAFEPACRRVAADLVQAVCSAQDVDLMTALALPFASRVQCAYLGWPASLADTLIQWAGRNHAATLAGDRAAMTAIGREFDDLVADLLRARRSPQTTPPSDLTETLLRDTVSGRPLTAAEITSIVRNWTMGEVGTIAASVGIVAHRLASDPGLQVDLRRHVVPLPEAIDEILRIHGPLVSNRRIATRRVRVGDRTVEAGDRLTINWIAANRDPRAFDHPDSFRLDRNPADNLLYGAGIHVCPGAGLARMELRVVMEEFLSATHAIDLVPSRPPTNALPPASGFAALPLRVVHAHA